MSLTKDADNDIADCMQCATEILQFEKVYPTAFACNNP